MVYKCSTSFVISTIILLIGRLNADSLANDAKCPDVQYQDPSYGYVYSPNFPGDYLDDIECIYKIKVPEGNTVRLVLYNLNLVEGCCDFFHVYSGADAKKKHQIAKLNGRENFTATAKQPLGITYETTDSNAMTLKFISDLQDHDKGFYARFDAIPTSKIDPTNTKCPPQKYTGAFGVIVSPKWPNIYESESSCDYHIEVANGKKIKLDINYFDTESVWDYLNVHDGSTSSSHKLASYSGSVASGTTVTSSGSTMYLSFLANMSVEKQGFSITYSTVD